LLFFQKILERQQLFYETINGKQEVKIGKYAWGVTTSQSYLPLDNSEYFSEKLTLVDWLRQWATTEEEREEVYIRGFLGKMIFSGEEALKLLMFFLGEKSALYAFAHDDDSRNV
jgi:ATPase components of ABC transporters with duplicated ATPase domains